MKYRPFRLAAGLFLLAWLLPLAAAEPGADHTADWEQRLQAAKTQQSAGKTQRTAAKSRYEAEKKICFKKFRVTDCQEDARRLYIISTNEARRIENQGLAAERQVKKEQLADKDASYAAEAPARAANLQEREAETKAERAKSESKRAAKLAEKEKKAATAASRYARDAERREKKRAGHEKQVAEKMEKARRREAESAD